MPGVDDGGHSAGLPSTWTTRSSRSVASRPLEELVQIVLDRQRNALWDVARTALDGYDNPPPGSPAYTDQVWSRSHDYSSEVVGALAVGARAGAIILDSADQHFMAAKTILASDRQLPLPAMTCMRAFHEAVLSVCHLFEVGITPEERLVRSVAGFLASIHGGIPVLHGLQDLVPDPQELATALESRAGAIGYFERIGIEVGLNKSTGHPQNVRYQGHVANLVPKITDLSNRHVPSLHYMYSLHSGAAHSQPWFLEGLEGPWDTILKSVVTPVFDLSDALAACLLGYVGLSADEIHEKIHLRRIAIMDRQDGEDLPRVDWRTYVQNTMPPAKHD